MIPIRIRLLYFISEEDEMEELQSNFHSMLNISLGTEDQLIPVETVQYYKKVMEKVGSRCDLFLYEGEAHGFFNYRQFDNYQKTLSGANRFLISLGFLSEDPVIEIK